MHEFNNRIAAQRQLLQTINGKGWEEELFGLSTKGIERWVSVNRIDSESSLVQLIKLASQKLFFLANKSQEQVSNEYKMIEDEFQAIANSIEKSIKAV